MNQIELPFRCSKCDKPYYKKDKTQNSKVYWQDGRGRIRTFCRFCGSIMFVLKHRGRRR